MSSRDAAKVDRCVCARVRFERLLELQRERGCDLDQLQDLTGAGVGCGACLPYIRLTISTGRTAHPIMPRGRARAARARGGSVSSR